MLIPFDQYKDEEFGVLIPTALVLACLGLTNSKLQQFRVTLKENEDYFREPNPNTAFGKIFYTAAGLNKLTDMVATPAALQVKQQLQSYLPALQPQKRPTAPIVSQAPQSVQPYATTPQGELDPFAPARRHRATETQFTQQADAPPPFEYQQGSYMDRAAMVAEQLAPHLAPMIAAQVGGQLNLQLAQLKAQLETQGLSHKQQQELNYAELLFQQQKLTQEQYESALAMILKAQGAGVSTTKELMNAAPKPDLLILEGPDWLADIRKLVCSREFQVIWGLGAFVIGAIIIFSSVPKQAPVYYQQPYAVPSPGAPLQ